MVSHVGDRKNAYRISSIKRLFHNWPCRPGVYLKPTFTRGLPWVPEGFFVFVLFCGDSERRSRDRERTSEKNTLVHDRGFAAHCRRKTKQKKPSGTQGTRGPAFINEMQFCVNFSN